LCLIRSFFFSEILRIQLFGTVRAEGVREFRLRVFPNINGHVVPIPLIVPDLFTGSADGQETP
jgi:hypothetical protein